MYIVLATSVPFCRLQRGSVDLTKTGESGSDSDAPITLAVKKANDVLKLLVSLVVIL